MRKHLWEIGIVAGIFFLTGGGWIAPARSAELKIASVDIQRAVNECNAGKEAKQEIAKEVEKFKHLVEGRQHELQSLKETLDKQAAMLNSETRAAKEREYQAKLRDYQRWGEDYQNDLNQKRAEKERAISQSLQKVIQKLGADDGYTLILEKNEAIVLYAAKAIDITDRVIKLHDVQKK